MATERTVDTRAGRIRCLEAGAGWPVVLIHGFPLNADMWKGQLDAVPDGWRYIAPDVRGFGPERRTGDGTTTMDDFAADVEALLDALEIERAVIGGVSMGGYVTFALFRRAPERFSGVLLADTRAQADTPEGRQGRRAMSELVRGPGGPSAVVEQMLPKLLGETSHRSRPHLAARIRDLALANAAEGLDGALHAMMSRPDSTPDLARISLPTLVIVGEEDALTPVADSELLHRSIQRSHLVVLPGAGHMSALETPDEFSRALSDFLGANM